MMDLDRAAAETSSGRTDRGSIEESAAFRARLFPEAWISGQVEKPARLDMGPRVQPAGRIDDAADPGAERRRRVEGRLMFWSHRGSGAACNDATDKL